MVRGAWCVVRRAGPLDSQGTAGRSGPRTSAGFHTVAPSPSSSATSTSIRSPSCGSTLSFFLRLAAAAASAAPAAPSAPSATARGRSTIVPALSFPLGCTSGSACLLSASSSSSSRPCCCATPRAVSFSRATCASGSSSAVSSRSLAEGVRPST